MQASFSSCLQYLCQVYLEAFAQALQSPCQWLIREEQQRLLVLQWLRLAGPLC